MYSFTASHRGGSGPPMVCIHGITDTWRTWDLVLPALERRRDVLAPTMPGHAGGPVIDGEASDTVLVDAVEQAMDEAGFETADIVGNSLGGYVALQLAMRGRATSVVALSPSGGWAPADGRADERIVHFKAMQELLKTAAPRADEIVSTAEGRRRATLYTTVNFEHIPAELLAHQMVGASNCPAVLPLLEYGRTHGWELEPERITCPVRVVWGTEDRILPWPWTAVRYREEWLPNADWVVLEGIGHCPQLDVPTETADLILGFTA